MVKRIDELTPEQFQAMPGWAKKWIDIGLCTDPADRPKFTRAVKRCYEAAAIDWHGHVVWVSSPLVLSLASPAAAAILEQLKELSTPGDIPVSETVLRDAIKKHLTPLISKSVPENICVSVEEAVLSCLRFHCIDDRLVDEAFARATANRKTLFHNWYKYIGGHLWVGGYGWGSSFMSFFRDVCGLELEGDLWERSKAYEETCESACWWWPHTDFVVVCERPREIHLEEVPGTNNIRRLHCETGPAVVWPDGWGVYSWHGVVVPSNWILNRDQLDPNEVIRTTDVEQRAAGAQIVGLNKMLSVLKTKVIDDSGSEDIGQLIEMTLPGLERPGRFLKARCPRNGTIVEGVPYVSDIDGLPIETALAAQAWRIGDPQSEYQHPPRRT